MPFLDLSPLPESLLSLPDDVSDDLKPVIYFQARNTINPLSVYISYYIENDGSLYISLGDSVKYKLGNIQKSDILSFIQELNDIGFLKIEEESLSYKHFDIEKTFLFGLLVKTKRKALDIYPEAIRCILDLNLKNLNKEFNYCGFDSTDKNPDRYRIMKVLEDGIKITESFFQNQVNKSTEQLLFLDKVQGWEVIPACSLDSQIEYTGKIRKEHLAITVYNEKYFKNNKVLMKFLIKPDGDFIYGIIHKSSGERYFDYKAIKDVNGHLKQFVRFTPPKYHGNPVCSWVTLQFGTMICQ
jgi:hypothetical protein